MLILMTCLMSVAEDIDAQETNNVDLNDDIIVSAGTRQSDWINDSTLFEAPVSKSKKSYMSQR